MLKTLLNNKPISLYFAIAITLPAVGCSSDSGDDADNDGVETAGETATAGGAESTADTDTDINTETETSTDTNTDNDTGTGNSTGADSGSNEVVAAASEGINFDHFLAGSIVGDVAEVDCVLSNGTETRCYQFNVTGDPRADHDTGPFCPRNIADGPEAGGKWLDNGNLVDLDGAFFEDLPNDYGPEWVLYDVTTGQINVTDTPESCQAAAQLNPPAEYHYHCIECTIEDFGGPVARQYTIPIQPTPRETIAELGNIFPGVSLNGVGLSFPADLDGIVATYNIAALDDCAGHVNNAESYHYHGANGCWHEVAQADDHAAHIGYALDGYAIHAMTNLDGGEPTDLDECRGHTDAVRGYHYHAASPGENMFIGCFHGEIVEANNGGGPGQRPPR